MMPTVLSIIYTYLNEQQQSLVGIIDTIAFVILNILNKLILLNQYSTIFNGSIIQTKVGKLGTFNSLRRRKIGRIILFSNIDFKKILLYLKNK